MNEYTQGLGLLGRALRYGALTRRWHFVIKFHKQLESKVSIYWRYINYRWHEVLMKSHTLSVSGA